MNAEQAGRRDEAERLVRRGDFGGALAIYQALCRERPDDVLLAERLRALEAYLQPMELAHPKAAPPPPGSERDDVEAGEAAANRGDLVGAVRAYARALSARPDNTLLAERLAELRLSLMRRLLDRLGRRRRSGVPG